MTASNSRWSSLLDLKNQPDGQARPPQIDSNNDCNHKDVMMNSESQRQVVGRSIYSLATIVEQSVRFLNHNQYLTLSQTQVNVLCAHVMKKVQEVQCNAELTAQEIKRRIDAMAAEVINWDKPEFCMMVNCGRRYYEMDPTIESYTIPVGLRNCHKDNANFHTFFDLFPTKEVVMCFKCALNAVEDSHGCENVHKAISTDLVDQILLGAPDSRDLSVRNTRRGMAVELAHLRAWGGIQPWWSQASRHISEAVMSLGTIIEADDGQPFEVLQTTHFKAVLSHLSNAFAHFHKNRNLARPIMLMGAPWFWNCIDVVFAMTNRYGSVYHTDAMKFDGGRITERVMEVFASCNERLWDGPLKMLRGNDKTRDTDLINKLTHALSNQPPMRISSHQADLRSFWNSKLESTMGVFWSSGPFSNDPQKFWVHPDMRPSNIALRLLEIMPLSLDHVMSVTCDAVSVVPTAWASKSIRMQPWHVLNDRYFEFIVLFMGRYLNEGKTALTRSDTTIKGARLKTV